MAQASAMCSKCARVVQIDRRGYFKRHTNQAGMKCAGSGMRAPSDYR